MYQDLPPAASATADLHPDELRALAGRYYPTAASLAAALDHTLLKADATQEQVLALTGEAAEHRFACAMVNPAWVPLACESLAGTGVRVGTVLAFPLGASLPATKQAEARDTAKAGARDLDMVLNVGALRSGMYRAVEDDIRAVAEIAHGDGAILKVILETCLLDQPLKKQAAQIAMEAGADFVKTSTGFSTGGATVEDVHLLRSTVGQRCGVKASGGIRSLSDAVRVTEAGASRIGASASVAILEQYTALFSS